ncbi:MAG TPA: CDP-alcohol phosphatidyltransferase family protein [Chloroflexia bacterium]|nr:CDP-alcohol phosphatidyltransferase family protein [Chloroflexia bacterium]HYP21113.1 CDP-alcohol phosphatidyltransferase family protein [Chloroflexia bacterium]
MLTQLLQDWARRVARGAARVFVKTPITPNMLTLFGLVLNGIVAILLATGHLVAGGVMMIFAGLFDMLDGALAKITERVSDFGAFLDSVVDRYSEAIVLLGLLLYYYSLPPSVAGVVNRYFAPLDPKLINIVLIYAILFGSMMISYARARAGALKIKNEVGILARPERLVLLAVGLLFQTVLLEPVLWLLAIGTQITAVQRIVHVWQVTSGKKQG